MVQKIQTIYIDDITGKESPEIETHTFALNGVNYEIDLASESYDALADALTPYIEAGRKVSRAKNGAARKSATDGPSAEEMRTWARESGYEVNDRGRVPRDIREAYEAAH